MSVFLALYPILELCRLLSSLGGASVSAAATADTRQLYQLEMFRRAMNIIDLPMSCVTPTVKPMSHWSYLWYRGEHWNQVSALPCRIKCIVRFAANCRHLPVSFFLRRVVDDMWVNHWTSWLNCIKRQSITFIHTGLSTSTIEVVLGLAIKETDDLQPTGKGF